jgi:hypothetical protein
VVVGLWVGQPGLEVEQSALKAGQSELEEVEQSALQLQKKVQLQWVLDWLQSASAARLEEVESRFLAFELLLPQLRVHLVPFP